MSRLSEAKNVVDERKRTRGTTLNSLFRKFADATARAMGSKWSFVTAILLIGVWASSYPLFKKMPDGFNTWQLVINTLTTIITFLMVFLIQSTQNRDAKAIHLKLDELIRAVEGARTHLVDLESLDDEDLERLDREFKRIHAREKAKDVQRHPSAPQLPPVHDLVAEQAGPVK